MRKLSPEEAANLPLIKSGRETWVHAMVKNLQTGEALIIENKDWNRKGAPFRIANAISRKTGMKFQKGRMPDGSGWMIKRIS